MQSWRQKPADQTMRGSKTSAQNCRRKWYQTSHMARTHIIKHVMHTRPHTTRLSLKGAIQRWHFTLLPWHQHTDVKQSSPIWRKAETSNSFDFATWWGRKRKRKSEVLKLESSHAPRGVCSHPRTSPQVGARLYINLCQKYLTWGKRQKTPAGCGHRKHGHLEGLTSLEARLTFTDIFGVGFAEAKCKGEANIRRKALLLVFWTQNLILFKFAGWSDHRKFSTLQPYNSSFTLCIHGGQWLH